MSGLCDCGGEHLLTLPRKAALVPWPGQQGALGAGLRRSSPCAPGDSALCLGDLSWASTEVTGPGFWVARKGRQMVDHLRDKHP